MEKEKTQISLTLAENESVIRTWCENCDDIQIRPMKLGKTGGTGALLIYVEVAVSCVMLKDSVIGKLLNRLMEVPEADIPGVLSENQLGISDALEFDTMEAAFASMLAGNAILFVDHYDRAVKIGSKGYPNLGVQKAESEKVLRGSNEGFSDSVKTNTALVRKRLRTTDLKVEEIHFGARSDTVLALVYEKELIYPKFLEEVKQQIAGWEVDGVFDKDKIALVLDHFVPNKDIKSAQHCKCVREFACRHDITNYFDVGEMGIEHALLPEKGLTVAGDVIIGADSHTCTYGALGAFSTGVGSTDMAAGKAWFKVPAAIKFNLTGKPAKWISGKDIILHIIGMIGVDGALYKSMEFVGDGIQHLSMDDRFTIANMAIEAGGKNGIFPVDDLTKQYMEKHSKRPYVIYEADEDAEYEQEFTIDLSTLKPTIAFPHLPENTHTIDEVGEIKIDQVVIGSCTNGRMDDLRVAASILKGHRVAKGLRVIVIPATQQIYLDAMEEGLLKTFIEAGAVVSTPTCGPCLGGYMGILAEHERCVSTTNRNFVGRMGHVESEIYLASPAVAAASAITGKLSGPDEIA